MRLRDKLRVHHRAWRYRLRTEKREIRLIRDLIAPGDSVLDVGAHRAAFTFWMAQAAGPSGSVFGFEPHPQMADYLREIVAELPLSNVQVVEAGLSDHTGVAKLHVPGLHLGTATLEYGDDPSLATTEVAIYDLDSFCAKVAVPRPIRVVKCDVERHELAMFRGAQHVLTEDRPVLLFETGDHVLNPELCGPVFDLLRQFGYHGYYFRDWTLTPVPPVDRAALTLDPDALGNYVFAHPRAAKLASLKPPYRVEWSPSAPRRIAA
jgi:FkbM family methyltransferase